MKRSRMTWAKDNRKASAPPATPGYGAEDQDHPAHQADPAHEQYAKGDPSAWAEDVRQPPYPEGNPPADPGYDVEDQDHPAHKRAPRVPKEASLCAAVEKKAAKCMAVASKMLGKSASIDMVEAQAFDLLDMDDNMLNAAFERSGGDFLGFDEEDALVDDDEGIEDMLSMGVEDEVVEDEFVEDEFEDSSPIMSRMKAMEDEIASLRASSNQNAPGGDPNAPNDTPDNPVMAMFDALDTDRDGFVSSDEWRGSKAVFASLDTDSDGIIARSEVVGMFGFDEEVFDEGVEAEDLDLMAEDECGCGVTAAKKSDDDEAKEEKTEEEGAEEAEEEADDEKEGAKKKAGCEKLPEGAMRDNCEKKKEEGGDADKDKDDKGEKEAASDAGMFSMTADPMGLGDGTLPETDGIDDALLDEVFGGRSASDDEEADADADEGGEEEADDEKEGGKKASQRPQRPKSANGPKTVGQMTRTASADDLSGLWETSPDVSDVFNS